MFFPANLWASTEENKPNTTKANNRRKKWSWLLIYVCISLCTTLQLLQHHITLQHRTVLLIFHVILSVVTVAGICNSVGGGADMPPRCRCRLSVGVKPRVVNRYLDSH